MKILKLISGSLFVAALLVAAVSAQSAPGVQVTDPGVQTANRGTGAALPSVLVNGHLFLGTASDTMATYRVRG